MQSARPTSEQLSRWVDEFRAQGSVVADTVKIIPIDGNLADDTEIVVVPLRHAPASIYLELDAEARWNATLTERNDALSGSSLDLVALGTEVAAAGELCAFLQGRTDARA